MVNDFLVKKDQRVVLREELDEWGILFNPDTSEVVSINGTGIEIWKSIEGPCDLKSIVEALQAQFDRIPEEMPEQVRAFIDALIKRGFIKNLNEEENEKP